MSSAKRHVVTTPTITTALLLALGASGCGSTAGDEHPVEDEDSIVGGTTDVNDPAVVAINIESTGLALCSGHASVRGSARHRSFSGEGKPYDVALIQLEKPLAGVTPIALSETPLSSADVGSTVRHIGFGTTGDDWNYVKKIATGGLKREASYPITKVDDFFVWSSAPGKQTCIFDSGGPTLLSVNGTERLIGVVSPARIAPRTASIPASIAPTFSRGSTVSSQRGARDDLLRRPREDE